VPPARTHRNRYFGVLAPNSLLRCAVTAMAAPVPPATAQAKPATTGDGAARAALQGNAVYPKPESVALKRSALNQWACFLAAATAQTTPDRRHRNT